MSQTLSVVQACIGGIAGTLAPHPEVVHVARSVIASAIEDGVLLDGRVFGHGQIVSLVLSHDVVDSAVDAHRVAWQAISAAADVARQFKLENAGHGLGADAFHGSLTGTGVSVASLTLNERPAESVLVGLAASTAVGVFNYPLVRAFADPFSSASLVASSGAGFNFEVNDLVGRQKTMIAAPAGLHALLAHATHSDRFVVRTVVTGGGEMAAAASTERSADVTGFAGDDVPAVIARVDGLFPSVAELLRPFHDLPSTPRAPGERLGILYPSALPADDTDSVSPALAELTPRSHALLVQLARGKIVAVRDAFADPSFANTRGRAWHIASWADGLGPFAPRSQRVSEPGQAAHDEAAHDEAYPLRWSDQ